MKKEKQVIIEGFELDDTIDDSDGVIMEKVSEPIIEESLELREKKALIELENIKRMRKAVEMPFHEFIRSEMKNQVLGIYIKDGVKTVKYLPEE